jgi:hypothetical protein
MSAAKLLDQAAALNPGTAQSALFGKAVHNVNKTTTQFIGSFPLAEQNFGAASRLSKAAELTGTSGLGSISTKLDEAATSARGVRLIESAEHFPEIHFTGPMLGPSRSLADTRSSAQATLQLLGDVMPDLRTAARGQQIAVAGIGGAGVLAAAGGTAYLVSR